MSVGNTIDVKPQLFFIVISMVIKVETYDSLKQCKLEVHRNWALINSFILFIYFKVFI